MFTILAVLVTVIVVLGAVKLRGRIQLVPKTTEPSALLAEAESTGVVEMPSLPDVQQHMVKRREGNPLSFLDTNMTLSEIMSEFKGWTEDENAWTTRAIARWTKWEQLGSAGLSLNKFHPQYDASQKRVIANLYHRPQQDAMSSAMGFRNQYPDAEPGQLSVVAIAHPGSGLGKWGKEDPDSPSPEFASVWVIVRDFQGYTTQVEEDGVTEVMGDNGKPKRYMNFLPSMVCRVGGPIVQYLGAIDDAGNDLTDPETGEAVRAVDEDGKPIVVGHLIDPEAAERAIEIVRAMQKAFFESERGNLGTDAPDVSDQSEVEQTSDPMAALG